MTVSIDDLYFNDCGSTHSYVSGKATYQLRGNLRNDFGGTWVSYKKAWKLSNDQVEKLKSFVSGEEKEEKVKTEKKFTEQCDELPKLIDLLTKFNANNVQNNALAITKKDIPLTIDLIKSFNEVKLLMGILETKILGAKTEVTYTKRLTPCFYQLRSNNMDEVKDKMDDIDCDFSKQYGGLKFREEYLDQVENKISQTTSKKVVVVEKERITSKKVVVVVEKSMALDEEELKKEGGDKVLQFVRRRRR